MSTTKQSAKPKPGAKPAPTPVRGIKKPVHKSVENKAVAGTRPENLQPTRAKTKTPTVRPPLTDAEVGPIPELPSEAEIEQQAGALSPVDKGRFTKIRGLLARQLGSHAAARVWLTTPGRGFDGTPLDAIRNGMADLVLDVLKSQSSPNPPYA